MLIILGCLGDFRDQNTTIGCKGSLEIRKHGEESLPGCFSLYAIDAIINSQSVTLKPVDDFNRITIKSGPVNYINASMVRAPNNPRQFIVTQGPLQNTINDFWQMIVENNCKTIIMLCKTVEKGVEKCAMYWPEEGERLSLYNGLELFQTRCDFIQEIGAYERIFEIRDKKGSHIHSVVQLNYTRWPDRKTPRPESFAKFVQYSRRAFQSHSQGVVVHCRYVVTTLNMNRMLCVVVQELGGLEHFSQSTPCCVILAQT